MEISFFQDVLHLVGPVGLLFVGVILSLLFWGLLHYLVPVLRTALTIKKASRKIATSESGISKAFDHGPRHFGSLWKQYLDERSESPIDGDVSAVAPETWFTPSSVLPTYNRSGALALAGTFAGLGILGTFVGLMIGLVGINTAEGKVLGSVTTFIGGMSTAFWSSIFGIGASLLWLALDRGVYNHLLVRLGEFHAVVRLRLPTLSAEQILGRLLLKQASSVELLQSQKGILQNLGTDISAAFEDAINRTLTPAMVNISESLDTMSTQVSDQQAEALGQMAQRFQEELMGSVSEQFGNLAESVQAAADYQARVNDDITSLFDRLAVATDGQISLIENTTRASEVFSTSLQALGDVQDRLAGAADKMSTVTERLDLLAEGLGKQVEEYGMAQRSLQQLMAGQLDASAAQIAELNEFFGDLSGHLTQLSTNLERSITEFSGLASDKLGEVFNRFDSELSTIIDHLSGTLAQIRDVTEDFPRAVEDLRSAIGDAVDPIRSLDGRLAAVTTVVDAVEKLEASTSGVAEELRRSRRALEELSQKTEAQPSDMSGARPLDGGTTGERRPHGTDQ